MNERIQELASQAGAGINYTDNGEPFGVHFNKYETFEKFAELIVQECAKACEENSYLALNGWQRAKQIREHFGVEE